MKRSVIAFLLVPIFSPSLLSQQVHFQHLTIDDGLSQDIVTAIVQDDQGFMWFGTEDGLNQYDGTSFTVYKHNPNDSTTLSSNFIGALLADMRGHLWVSTSLGIDLFDIRTKTFQHIAAMGGPHISSTGFCQGADSSVWIGSSEGLFRYKGGKFSRADLDGQPMTHTVWGMLSEGNLMWVVDTAGLHCYVVQQEHLQSVELPPALHPLRGLSRIFRDREHQLWVCTWNNGIFRFDPTLGFAEHYTAKPGNATALRDNSVRTGLEDREGTLWFGTSSGLEKFDPSHDGFIHFESGPGNPSGFLGDRVYALCVDRTGILWVGTYRGGVNAYAPARQKFRAMTLSPGTKAEDVFAVSETPDGKILVGTDNGLYSWGGSADGSWIPYSKFEGKPILSTARLGNKDTWVGTEGSIERLGGSGDGPGRITLPVNDDVRVIFQDRDGQLWIGTDKRGLYVVDRATCKVARWSPPDGEFTGGAWSMYQDRAGQLWIGTWESEYSFRYDKQHGTVVRYGNGTHPDVYLSSPAIRVFREDTAGTLWIGTWGGGIYHLDTLDRPVEHFSEIEGLASDFVKSMEIDDRGKFWIGTERGLSFFDPVSRGFTTYTQRDGLPSSFFYSGASFMNREGLLFFGGQKGLVAFNPDSIRRNVQPPPVAITGFRVLDKPVPPGQWASHGGEVTLRYDQDFFSFEYVALDFTAPEKNQYAYQLEGFDRGWVQAGTRCYAAYTHLDPGTYRFHVKASNNDGIWNEAGATMAVIVTPAFWMTWWFRLAAAVAFAFAIYLTYRYRLRTLLEVEHLRQRIARDLHDDIGTNLSAIVLASQMTDQEEVPPAIREYAADVRSIALETQEHMRDIVWMLNPRNDSLELLIARMKDDAARLLREGRYSFTSTQETPEKIDLTQKRNIFLVYKEALHNAVKHSGATHVDITIEARERMLEFHIQDNGCGFDPAKVAAGNGLDNMRARAGQMGGTLKIQSGPGKGTSIHLRAKIA